MASSSNVGGEKHCRACMSVEDLMRRAGKLAKKVSTENAKNLSTSPPTAVSAGTKLRKDCPVTIEKLGRSTWNLLHTVAAYYPVRPTLEEKKDARSMMNLLGKMYPCSHCAEDLQRDLAEHPPDVEGREKFSLWMCDLHNRVNKKLNKPEFDCSKWKERWRDGWKDGSCDY